MKEFQLFVYVAVFATLRQIAQGILVLFRSILEEGQLLLCFIGVASGCVLVSIGLVLLITVSYRRVRYEGGMWWPLLAWVLISRGWKGVRDRKGKTSRK